MTKYCCAPGCLNVLNQNKNITFHRFPHKRPDILEKWIHATKMKNFEANLFAMICSEHFAPDCYTENNLHRKILKKEAIPTIFKISNDKMKNCNRSDDNESLPCSSDKVDSTGKEIQSTNQNEIRSEKVLQRENTNYQLVEEPIKDGWFTEISDMWPGQKFGLKVENIISRDKSEYQNIMLLQTCNHGKALVLDGIIQCTESDEFSYQEMIAFLPLCAHPTPEKVLIIGGGDGGVAREVNKHPLVKEIVQVEIDEKVVDICKKHLPNMAKGFDSSKLDLKIGDGFEYLSNHKNEFDIIITDSSDPIGPAAILFTESYFSLLKEALKPNGIICNQAGTIWAGLDQVKNAMSLCRKHFKVVRYSIVSVPTYPTGQIGFLMASLDENADLTIPVLKFTGEDLEKYHLKYYNSRIHSASFILPNFATKALYG